MKIFRLILFPFSILYLIITSFRNFLYDNKILKSYNFDLPIVCVGNLNVGGTGKTPQIEYLINLLSKKYKIATLSRGYKRTSKGFILANNNSNAQTLGDEPFQFFLKFKNVQVAVDADRKNGIEKLLSQPEKPNLILLDDAFQHRKVKAGFYVLLTAFNDLFTDDFLLPTGNLRESRIGATRANAIVITKCPENLSEVDQHKITKKINSNQPIFFSKIQYDDYIYSSNGKLKLIDTINKGKLIIAGIANPTPFFDYLKNSNNSILTFPDHHDFTENDLENIKTQAGKKLIITTEKDYVRLKKHEIKNLYYLPIKSSFLENSVLFDNLILDFINNFKA
ncbi:MAG: tetraacyldisaccharide 4'-kinase [Flavobacterium sp.]|nr:tetraacyldisaccharide 4'-kinase [Flavobacterium sp.]